MPSCRIYRGTSGSHPYLWCLHPIIQIVISNIRAFISPQLLLLTMPDIDSITQSFSSSHAYSNGTHSPPHHSPSRYASSSSLAAAATINAGFQNEESRRSSTSSTRGRPSPQVSRNERERRRSNVFLGSYDPTLPGPGELQVGDLRGQSHQGITLPFRSASPHAIGSPIMGGLQDRAPSLGELHQELEAEQEAQVVSMLLKFVFGLTCLLY